MISITNISATDAPQWGVNQYVVKINNTLLASFEHKRSPQGLARCLRDAARAIEKHEEQEFNNFIEKIQGVQYSGSKKNA